jgi:hypothetical protein
MTRARILADYVSSGDELALKAPIAGPTFTGTVAIPNVANLETAVVANTAKVTNYNQTLADINALDVTELGTVTSGSIGSGVTGLTGIKHIDSWRINTNAALGSSAVVTANWERDDTAFGTSQSFTGIGTGFTAPSSGVFTFPTEGFWLVMAFGFAVGDTGAYVGWNIAVTTDASTGATYTFRGESYCSTNGSDHNTSNASCIVDVTDVDEVKLVIKSNGDPSSGSWSWHGQTNGNKSGVHFFRLGDT